MTLRIRMMLTTLMTMLLIVIMIMRMTLFFTHALLHRVISDGFQQVAGVCRRLQETAAFYKCFEENNAMCNIALFFKSHRKHMVFADCEVGPLRKAGRAAVWLAVRS